MNTLNNQQQSHNSWSNQVTKLAVSHFNHPSFNLVQFTSANEDIASLEINVNELMIETEPELIVIMGYAEFDSNLEIYNR
jgi:hypothetical protein